MTSITTTSACPLFFPGSINSSGSSSGGNGGGSGFSGIAHGSGNTVTFGGQYTTESGVSVSATISQDVTPHGGDTTAKVGVNIPLK